MSIGSNIKKIRKSKKMTIRDLVELSNVGKSTISDIENDNVSPTAATLEKLANALGVSVDSFFKHMEKEDVVSSSLTQKDEKEINKILDSTKKQLENSEGLMFDGEPASQEAIQSILDAMKVGMEIAKERNKKYTPDKYKTNK